MKNSLEFEKLTKMIRAFSVAILPLVCLLSTAQTSYRNEKLDTVARTYLVAVNHSTEINEDKFVEKNNYKLKDNSGNTYKVVSIGTQFWMAENLKATKLNDGTDIPMIYYYKTWSSLGSPGYCWYNNDVLGYKTNYGALYNWYTINTGKLCPMGWHVPTLDEWTTLINYCGENKAGGKLKDISKKYWMSPNTDATNETGFTALPGGCRGNFGSYMDIGLRGHWWSSTADNDTKVWNSAMGYSYGNVTGSTDKKNTGLSVRCVKDD